MKPSRLIPYVSILAVAATLSGERAIPPFQGTTPQTPQEVYWAIIAALSSAVVALFWQLMRTQTDLVKAIKEGAGNLEAVTTAIKANTEVTAGLERALRLDEKIRDLGIERRKRQ